MSEQPTKQGSEGDEKKGAAAAASGRASTASSASQPAAAASAASSSSRPKLHPPVSGGKNKGTAPLQTSSQASKSGRREEEEERIGERGASSSAGAVGKRDPTATAPADSSFSSTQEPVIKESRGEEYSTHAAAASTSSSAAAAASSSSSPSQLRPPRLSFFSSVQTLLAALSQILTRLYSLRRSTDGPLEAERVVQLQEAREELLQIQAQLVGAPQRQQELQSRISRLQDIIVIKEQFLADVEEDRRTEERKQQIIRTQLARTEGEQSASQLAIALAGSATATWEAHYLSLTSQVPPDVQEMQRRWQARACAVLEQLAASLTADEIRAHPHVLSAYAQAGLLPALDRLLAQSGSECVFENSGSIPYLSQLASYSPHHIISLIPLLHFLHYGLDTTCTSSQYPRSALQLAREHVQAHPLPPPRAGTLQSMTDSLEQLEEGGWLPNLATEYAALQTEATWAAEFRRRHELHARFMHALVSAWRAHSSKVRALLLEAAPEQLIPDLAKICAEYLDLEPAEKRRH